MKIRFEAIMLTFWLLLMSGDMTFFILKGDEFYLILGIIAAGFCSLDVCRLVKHD